MVQELVLDAYERVSTEEQAKDGISLQTQTSRIDAYAELYGRDEKSPFRIRAHVVDAGYSAKTMDRPGLQGILERLRSGEVDGVILTKLDRLTRSLADWARLIDDYFGERKGKRLISVDNQVDTRTANGRLMLNLIVMISQWEREIISERTKENLRDKISRGERCGKVRFGHDLGPDGKTLVENTREREAIRLMKELEARGLSLRGIARTLEEMGIETKEGNHLWLPATIAKIIKRAG